MSMFIQYLTAAALLLGTFLMVVTAIGLLRFPDVFCRMHAAGKAGTLGIVFIILASMIFAGAADTSIVVRGVLAIIFQFLTTPAATHLLSRAAYLSNYPLSERTAVNELKGMLPSLPDDAPVGQE